MMRTWLNSRQNQIRVFFVIIAVVTVTNFILPAIENRTYFASKSERVQTQIDLLENTNLHLKRHINNQPSIKARTLELNETLLAWKNPSDAQKTLARLCADSGVTTIQQKIESTLLADNYLSATTIKQTLEGRYENISEFLRLISDKSYPVIIESCDFFNLEPTNLNPKIRLSLILKTYQNLDDN